MQKEQQELANLIKGKKVAFIGAGVSHKTLIREFVELGAHVTLCDQKKSVEDFGDYAATIKELGIDLSLGENYLDGFKGQDIIMRTPGFVGYFEKPLQDAMAAGTMVTSEVELFFQFCPCEIVAVTGSDGKTTTTTLISKFYEAAGRKVHLGGNIGAALLPMLPEVRPEDVAVVELSSFQLISMHQSPKIESMMEEIKALHSENEKLKSKLAKEAMGDVMDQVQDVKGVKVLAVRAAGVDMNGLRNLGDQLKEKLGEGVGVIASVLDGKVNLMAAVTDEAQKKGAHAGNLIKAIAGLVGGGGGGRPNMAQAGGKNPEGVADALAKVAEVVSEQVK